jgi:signal transduction histidine kinase
LDEVQEQHQTQLFRQFSRLRLRFAIIPLGFAVWLFASDPVLWRKLAFLVMFVTFPTVVILDEVAMRRAGVRSLGFSTKIQIVGVVHLIIVFATGGLESPVYPTTIPLALLLAAFARPGWARSLLRVSQYLVVWVFYFAAMRGWVPNLVPAVFGGGSRAGHNDTLLLVQAGGMTLFLSMAWGIGSALRGTYDELLAELFRTRDQALKLHADQTQLLTTLSAEIAHELKNPLSSIKGLAALTAKDLDGKNAERMGVLRREVDRMQAILDEFLDFSRPLGPLSQELVDLAELCGGVAALHEAMCQERGVSVRVRAEDGPVQVRCDPRKVKQIVINLLQNAIDASPAGGAIEFALSSSAEGVRVAVLDRGAGLATSVAGRAFEPGVTTKSRGSGLGLTVARAIARQHGGDLSLSAREGGGCAAELSLPSGAA